MYVLSALITICLLLQQTSVRQLWVVFSTQSPMPGSRDIQRFLQVVLQWCGRVLIRVPHDFPTAWDLAGLPHNCSKFFARQNPFQDADEVVAVRRIEFNPTRDASHVQVHSISLTSKTLPSVPDTPSEQPLVLAGWCCCCLLRSCVVPIWSSKCCPAFSAHTWARLRLRSPDGGPWSSSALQAEKVIQCSGCGVNRTRSAH